MASKEKHAVMHLYEELYDSMNDINPRAIHDAMKVLMEAYDLEKFMTELSDDFLCVVHENRVRGLEDKIITLEKTIKKVFENV